MIRRPPRSTLCPYPTLFRAVERLRDDALPGEGRVAVDQDRQRDGRVVDARAARAVGLLRPCPADDDGVDGLQVAGIGRQRDREDRKSTRLNSSHANISYAVF